jgi:hypothetical protein
MAAKLMYLLKKNKKDGKKHTEEAYDGKQNLLFCDFFR